MYNRDCAKALLRIIYLLPPSLKCVQTIKKNMLQFAEMSKELDASPREVEWEYTWRLLRVIKNLRNTKGLECNATLYILAKVNKTVWEEGNYVGYYFGSVNLHQWVNAFLAKEQARKALQDEIEGNPVVTADIMAERNRLTLAQLEEESQERRRRYEEAQEEPDQGEEDAPALGTPTKNWDTKSPKWTDSMKLELLRLWIIKSENPLVRSEDISGKGVYKIPIREMMEEGVGIKVEGQKYSLQSLVSVRYGVDTLAGILQGVQGKGFSGQRSKDLGKGGLGYLLLFIYYLFIIYLLFIHYLLYLFIYFILILYLLSTHHR